MLFFAGVLQAQVTVERSKDKVVIGGESYYIHIVKKGETYYSISRAYGMTSDQLLKENPSAGLTIKDGQSLRIPVKLVSDSAPPAVPQIPVILVHDNSRFVYHKLNHGETIYFLSKTYNVSEESIIESNPGLDITKLPVGSEIAIPRKEAVATNFPSSEKTNEKQDKNYYHRVVAGETLSSIARQYKLSLREIKRANRDIRFPQVGDYIVIPGLTREETMHPKPVVFDTLPAPIEPEAGSGYFVRPLEYTPVNNLKGSVNIAVLLPFYLTENAARSETDSTKSAKGKTEYRRIVRSDDWIYPGSIEFIEMYNGILLAADTLRALGLNIDIHTFDIKGDTIELMKLINSGTLDDMDLIIGPVYSRNLSILASYTRKLGIPVVSPVPLFSNSVLLNNPYLFLAGSSLIVAQKAIARKSVDYSDHNFVLVYSPGESNDSGIAGFKRMITEELLKKIPEERINIKNLVFYSRSEYGTDSVKRLERAMSGKTGNVVIIASDDPPVMSEALMEVRNLSRKFDLKVFGYPEMQSLGNIDPKLFFDLGLMVYSPYWIDYSSGDVTAFNSDFRKKFYTEPAGQSYAWQGYDIAYYFLSGLAIHGKTFLQHPEIHNPDLLHTEFDFRRDNTTDGFENQKLFLVRYTNDFELENIDEKNRSGSVNGH